MYDHTYHDCDAWLSDVQHRLESCSNSDGDKFATQNKLEKLQELMNLKDEGFEKMQQTVNSSHHVLPNTTARGKDEIRGDIQKLQKAWDDLFANMNSAKVRLAPLESFNTNVFIINLPNIKVFYFYRNL